MKNIVISLFDYTGNMVRPFAEAGYECHCVDIQHGLMSHPLTFTGDGEIRFVKADVLSWLPANPEKVAMLFAFPPCTDVAVSGARWMKDKGLGSLINALQLFKRAVDIASLLGCPYMIENPVSTVSTYWRKPDHIFHPHQYAGLEPADNYTKKTCLWAGNGFIMPESCPDHSLGKPDDRIHKAPPGPDRANFRSATPMGFARAVFQANQHFDILTGVTK